MPLPAPEIVVIVLMAFLIGYGATLAIRTLRAARWAPPLDHCPACRSAWQSAREPARPSEIPAPEPGSSEPAETTVPEDARHAGAHPKPAETQSVERCAACGAGPPRVPPVSRTTLWMFISLTTMLTGVAALLLGLHLARDAHDDPGTLSIGPVLAAGIGFSLFGLHIAIMGFRGDRARGRRRCPGCWYIIDRALGLKCSECGRTARSERDLFRPRRRWRIATLGLVIIALGQACWMERRVKAGGWIAAVPTEILIIAMPLVPDHWLTDGTPGADEDWSLSGRMSREDGWHTWTWHRPWALHRATGLALAAMTTEKCMNRLDLLSALPDTRTPDPEIARKHDLALAHALALAIDRIDDPSDQHAGELLGAASDEFLFQMRHVTASAAPMQTPEHLARVAALVDARTEVLLAALELGTLERARGAAYALGLGDGRAEVIDALLVTRSHRFEAMRAASMLAERHPHVLRRLMEVLANPSDPRLFGALFALNLGPRGLDHEIEELLLACVGNVDPSIAGLAAHVISRRGSPEAVASLFSPLIELMRRAPESRDRAMLALYHCLLYAPETSKAAFLALADDPDPVTRSMYVEILSELRFELYAEDPVDRDLSRAWLRLIDTGEVRIEFGEGERDPIIRQFRQLLSEHEESAP